MEFLTAMSGTASGFAVVVLSGVAVVRDDIAANALQPGLHRPVDGVILVLVVLATLGVAITRSRIAATLCLSGVGILATAQIMALGAPDVGLTQLLVECLTVIVIMLVLQKLPRAFGSVRRDGDRVLLDRDPDTFAISVQRGGSGDDPLTTG